MKALLPQNKDRAHRAWHCLQEYMSLVGLDAKDEITEAITDLLADMLHFCYHHELNLDYYLEVARTHFQTEVQGEE